MSERVWGFVWCALFVVTVSLVFTYVFVVEPNGLSPPPSQDRDEPFTIEPHALPTPAPSIADTPVHVFYHLCTRLNSWRPIFYPMVQRLPEHWTLHLIVSGPDKPPDWPVQFHFVDNDQFERPTLGYLHRLAPQLGSAHILYMHSKGISRTQSPLQERIADWVEYMLYFLVDHHVTCRQLLDLGFDVVGVNLRKSPQPHFSGNFWWTTPAHVQSLPEHIGPKYTDPEFWVSQHGALGSLWQSHKHHYHQRYPPVSYRRFDRPHLWSTHRAAHVIDQLSENHDDGAKRATSSEDNRRWVRIRNKSGAKRELGAGKN